LGLHVRELSSANNQEADMAGGGFDVADAPSDYGGRVTFSVVLTCLMVASGGLILRMRRN
jgi:hypothetical protein